MFYKARIPAVVCAGLVGLAIAAAGSASACPFEGPPSEPDDVFMSELEAAGIQVLPREEAIGFADSVCDALADGNATPLGVAAATSDFTPMDMDESKVFVGVAVGAYCPEYVEMVSAELG
jgi:uncharacterized protein DUF732